MKRFDIITETDARTLDIGATVELSAGGHVTPLAKDTLAARRVTVIPAGSADWSLPADLAPVADIRRVAIGNDHTGVSLKRALVAHLRGRGVAVIDLGTDKTDPVDYPDVAGGGGEERRARRSGRRHRHRRRGHRIGDRGQQGARDPGGDVPERDDRPLLARAQRRQRDHAGVVAARRSRRGAPDRRDVWMGTPMREARYIRRLLKIRQLEERFGRD